MKIIEEWAFDSCENLKEIDIPDSVTEIGELAFRFCSNIEKVRLSNQLTVLTPQIFSRCEKLKELYVPTSVKKIERTALGWTDNLENLILNDGLEEIEDDFKYTKIINKLFIPKTVKKIQSGLAIVGDRFHKIEYEVSDENPYFSVVDGSLYNKDKTQLIAVFPIDKERFVVPKGVKIIEDFVFENIDLQQIDLPNTLTTIRHRCFENCLNLKKIRLPKSLKKIDFRAFDECVNLKVIEIEAIKPPKITNPSPEGWKFVGDAKKLTLYVPQKSLDEYKKAFGWKDIKKIKILPKD